MSARPPHPPPGSRGCLYGLFALAIGVFSHWPPYRHLGEDQALITLSFSHTGQPVSALAAHRRGTRLPPNMRSPLLCPRERSPVVVELDVDGAPALRQSPRPRPSKDGAASIYHWLVAGAGTHRVAVRMSDDARRASSGHVPRTDRDAGHRSW